MGRWKQFRSSAVLLGSEVAIGATDAAPEDAHTRDACARAKTLMALPWIDNNNNYENP